MCVTYGCSVIAIDLSPASTFITEYYCTPINLDLFEQAFEELEHLVRPTIDWLYETKTDAGSAAVVAYTVWAQVYRCDRCFQFVSLADTTEVAALNKDGSIRLNKNGEPATEYACPYCNGRGIRQVINTGSKRYARVPVRSSVTAKIKPHRRVLRRYNFPIEGRSKLSSLALEGFIANCENENERFELTRLVEIRDQQIPFEYPRSRMMNHTVQEQKWGVLWRSGVADFTTIDEVFEKRALWALSAYFDAARKVEASSEIRNAIVGILTSALWNCSKMYREREKGGGPQEGVYYLPPLSREVNVSKIISGKKATFVRANAELSSSFLSTNLLISTQSATNIGAIPNNSIDYIFTDPPYSWKVPYGELNFLWECFLGFDTNWHAEEITISDVRKIGELDWAQRMKEAFQECFRVLKPGRILTLCYHDSSEGTWDVVQEVLSEAGFVVEDSSVALSIGTGQKSLKQLTSGKITQRDLVINFRKPRPGEAQALLMISGDEDSATFGEKVHAIIRAFLADHPGSSKDRIYDEIVSRMVRAGQMEAHNFDALLAQVAEPAREPVMANLFEQRQPDLFGAHEIVRWYLKETALAVEDAAESAREEAAAKRVRGFVERKGDVATTGVHYSDILIHYLHTVTDKPRREIRDWLIDYFYKTDAGTYRVPLNDAEESEKAQARAAGINRRIRRYVSYLRQGIAIPERERASDATLVEWIRQCKRAALYEDGKLLYERGGLDLDRLSEEFMVSVEEDYQTCMRMLARAASAAGEEKARRGRKKADQQSMDI